MAKAKKKLIKQPTAKKASHKSTIKKSKPTANSSFMVNADKQLLKMLASLHDSAHKQFSGLAKQVKQLKAKLSKLASNKKGSVKKELEGARKALEAVYTSRSNAVKKQLKKFERDWKTNISKAAKAAKAKAVKTKVKSKAKAKVKAVAKTAPKAVSNLVKKPKAKLTKKTTASKIAASNDTASQQSRENSLNEQLAKAFAQQNRALSQGPIDTQSQGHPSNSPF